MIPRNLMRVSAVAILMPSAFSAIEDDRKQGPKLINYRDIPRTVAITGKLERPLGELVTVHGSWAAPSLAKAGLPPQFVVTEVDGHLLDTPISFDTVQPVWKRDEAFSRQTTGEKYELRGVETGGFVGFSEEVWDEAGQQPSQRPPSGFLTRFCYVYAKRIS